MNKVKNLILNLSVDDSIKGGDSANNAYSEVWDKLRITLHQKIWCAVELWRWRL